MQVLSHRSRRRSVQIVRDVYYALAGLGGHLGGKGDGLPGWQTLWRGLMSLRLLVEGVRLASQLNQFRDVGKYKAQCQGFVVITDLVSCS